MLKFRLAKRMFIIKNDADIILIFNVSFDKTLSHPTVVS